MTFNLWNIHWVFLWKTFFFYLKWKFILEFTFCLKLQNEKLGKEWRFFNKTWIMLFLFLWNYNNMKGKPVTISNLGNALLTLHELFIGLTKKVYFNSIKFSFTWFWKLKRKNSTIRFLSKGFLSSTTLFYIVSGM